MNNFLIRNEDTGELYRETMSRTARKFETKEQAAAYIKMIQSGSVNDITHADGKIFDYNRQLVATNKRVEKLIEKRAMLVKLPYEEVFQTIPKLERQLENLEYAQKNISSNIKTLKQNIARSTKLMRANFKVVERVFV